MRNALRKADEALEKIFRASGRVFEAIGVVSLLGLMCVLTFQTVCSWFALSFLWSDEIAMLMNVWLVFMGAAVVAHEKKHIQVDFIVQKMPCILQEIWDILLSALNVWVSYRIIDSGVAFIQKTRNITTTILKIPMIVLYSAIIVSFAFMLCISARYL